MSKAERIKEIIINELGIHDHSLVTDDAKLIEDLGADSLDCVELVMAFEEEYGIDISDDVVEGWRNVGDIVKGIDTLTKG